MRNICLTPSPPVYMPLAIWDGMNGSKSFHIDKTDVFYAVTVKYPFECVFVYHFVSRNVSLFSQPVCYIFV